jgi:hypothetical protein
MIIHGHLESSDAINQQTITGTYCLYNEARQHRRQA